MDDRLGNPVSAVGKKKHQKKKKPKTADELDADMDTVLFF
jgi:hypothetical protein